MTTPAERFLILKGSVGAGLGDKVRALVSAIAYARLTDRALYVEWNDPAYGDGTRNYFEDLFSVEGLRTVAQRPTAGRVRPALWQDRLDCSFDQLYAEQGPRPWDRAWAIEHLSFDQSVLDWPEEICVMWDFDQFPALMPVVSQLLPAGTAAHTQEQVCGALLRQHLRLQPDIEQKVAACRESLHARGSWIGIHVRATDESFQARGAPPVSAYLRAAEQWLRRSGADTLFLATDNRRVQELFCDAFGAERVIWTDKWLPEPGQALHLENDECPDRQQAAKDAVADIFLLASADVLITMNNSSFGILARTLSAAPAENRQTLMWHPPLWKRLWMKLGGRGAHG